MGPGGRARMDMVESVTRESETIRSFLLVPVDGGPVLAHAPGQSLGIRFDLPGHGVLKRNYSVSCAPNDRAYRITVKREGAPGRPAGLVSSWLHDAAGPGTVLSVAAPAGDFVLPSPVPPTVLLIAGGSGITPCMAMLGELRKRSPATRVTLLYFARSLRDRILAQQLTELTQRWTSFTYVPLDSTAHTPTCPEDGRTPPALNPPAAGIRTLDEALLRDTLPAWPHTVTYCCGPAPLMEAARRIWAQAGVSRNLHLEAFAAPLPSGDPNARHHVTLHRAGESREFDAAGNLTLLVAGEQAGFQIKHGCRQGICHECTCRLHRGSVQDLGSGQRIDGEGQPIRLCVSAALSDLDLESLN